MKKTLVFVLILAVISSIFVVGAYAESTDPGVDESLVTSEAVSAEEDGLAEDDTSSEGAIKIDFTTSRLPVALKHMAVGMIGVLIVLSLIAIVVFILNKVFKTK